jgi:methanogenic corrinoid protein MtbC1
MLDKLLNEAKDLLPITSEALADYIKNRQKMSEFVDSQMDNALNIDILIGRNPRSVMYNNHRHHAVFMSNVFRFSQFELLARTIPWVYASYHSHGFSYQYFLLELESWKNAVKTHMDAKNVDDILAIYNWMISKHQEMTSLATKEHIYNPLKGREISDEVSKLCTFLTEGQITEAYAYVQELVSRMSLGDLYLQVLQPCLYYVGLLWEEGKITVAQEHMASSMIMRIMTIAQKLVKRPEPDKGKAIVTASPNEYHEIGARMVADFLELDGWSVYYLGANVPPEELLSMIKQFEPDILAISLTMPFNLDLAGEIVALVRKIDISKKPKVIVGGQIFNSMPELHKCLNVDGYADDAKAAVELANALIAN